MVQGLWPALYRVPLFGDVHQGQVQQLDRGSFPNEEAAIKLLYLALMNVAKKWAHDTGLATGPEPLRDSLGRPLP